MNLRVVFDSIASREANKNPRQDTETNHLSQVQELRKEAFHDQRPKLGIPTYD